MPLLRQRQEVLGKERDLLDVHRELARSRAEKIAAHPDVVPQVEQSIQLEALFAHRIFLDVDLKPLPVLLQMSETRLAHQPVRHDAPGHADVNPRLLQLLGGFLRIRAQNLRNRVSVVVAIRVRPLAQGFNLFQLLAAEFVDILVEWQAVLFDSIAAKLPQKSSEAKWETMIINKRAKAS